MQLRQSPEQKSVTEFSNQMRALGEIATSEVPPLPKESIISERLRTARDIAGCIIISPIVLFQRAPSSTSNTENVVPYNPDSMTALQIKQYCQITGNSLSIDFKQRWH